MNTTKRTLYQAALLQSLVLGHYEGFIPVKDIMGHGDFGIGTFDSLDGELVMVDGQVYQVNGRGEVKKTGGKCEGSFCGCFLLRTGPGTAAGTYQLSGRAPGRSG